MIAADEIIKGPKVEEAGRVLVLPDSEHSYATVYSLKNGGYAMAFQVNPTSCDAVFDALEDLSMVAFEFDANGATTASAFKKASYEAVNGLTEGMEGTPVKKSLAGGVDGVSLKLRSEEEDKKPANLKRIEGQCQKNGSLMVVAGCAGGSYADYNSSDFICTGCTGAQVEGADGTCCAPGELCDGYCQCPKGEKYTGTDGQCHCIVCDESAANHDAETCKKRHNLYTRHVCYGKGSAADCYECYDNDDDCRLTGYHFSRYADKNAYYNMGFTDATVLSCTDGRHCRECNAHAYKDSDKTNTKRQGDKVHCPTDRPVCSNLTEGGVCQKCPGNQEFDVTDGTCKCPGGVTPVDGNCILCQDNASYGAQDIGCGSGTPICYPLTRGAWSAATDVKYGSTATKDSAGLDLSAKDTCVECTLNGHCKSASGKEVYCDSRASAQDFNSQCTGARCDERKELRYAGGADHEYAYACKIEPYCRDTKKGAAADLGCASDPNGNLCVPEANSTKNNGDGADGTMCKKCFHDDSADGAAHDDGCDSAAPICRLDSGNYGSSCAVCRDTNAACIEDGTPITANLDLGCTEAAPVCLTAGSKNDGSGTYGSGCVQCLSSDDCPVDKYCDTKTHTCKLCNQEGTARRARCGGQCECPPGTHPFFDSTESTSGDHRYTCEPGCLQHTDCAENYCCSCTGSGCGSNYGRCRTQSGWIRPATSNEACKTECTAPCEEYNPATGQCESTCKANEICMQQSGNANIDTCGGWKCVAVTCNMIHLKGKKNGRDFWIPPAKRKYRMTHASATRYCQHCGKQLASLAVACNKDYKYDSGHDCPNISGNQTFSDQGNTYSLGDWSVSDRGSFWLADLASTSDSALRVTYSCGNNHEDHMCLDYYPLCTD